MLSQFPVDVYDKVMSKSRISPVPTLDDKYYHLNEVEPNIDENCINKVFLELIIQIVILNHYFMHLIL